MFQAESDGLVVGDADEIPLRKVRLVRRRDDSPEGLGRDVEPGGGPSNPQFRPWDKPAAAAAADPLRLDLASVIGGPLDQHVAVVRAHLTSGSTEAADPVIPDAKKRSLVITLLDKLSEKVGMAEQQRGEAVERLASERNRCQVTTKFNK